jgi:hypothetical protein
MCNLYLILNIRLYNIVIYIYILSYIKR